MTAADIPYEALDIDPPDAVLTDEQLDAIACLLVDAVEAEAA